MVTCLLSFHNDCTAIDEVDALAEQAQVVASKTSVERKVTGLVGCVSPDGLDSGSVIDTIRHHNVVKQEVAFLCLKGNFYLARGCDNCLAIM